MVFAIDFIFNMFIYALMQVFHFNYLAFFKKCISMKYRDIFIQTNNFRELFEDFTFFRNLFPRVLIWPLCLKIIECSLEGYQACRILLFVRVDDALTPSAQNFIKIPPFKIVIDEFFMRFRHYLIIIIV